MEHILLPRQLNPFWATRFTIIGRVDEKDYKLFQVFFKDSNGSLWVNFPYFPEPKGFITEAHHSVDGSGETLVDYKEGFITSHLVKYNHPPDGRAHFSQDGKIKTLMRQSVPLDELDGHMFSIYLSAMTQFTPMDRDANQLRTTTHGAIVIAFPEGDPGWVKIVGYWYRRERALTIFKQHTRDRQVGPIIEGADGIKRFFPGPWYKGKASKYVLVFEVTILPQFAQGEKPNLLFLGGFDKTSVTNDTYHASSMLTFRYPAEGFEKLSPIMTSIDYTPELPKGS